MRYQMSTPPVAALHKVAFLRNIECSAEDFVEILAWLEIQFGPGAEIHNGNAFRKTRWCYSNTSWNIWFMQANDGLMFKLRWC